MRMNSYSQQQDSGTETIQAHLSNSVKDEQAEVLEAELQNAGLPAKIVGTLFEKNANEAEIIVE